MTQTDSISAKTRRFAMSGNAFVLLAISVVGIGLGVALRVHMGMPQWAAIVGAVFIFSGLVVTHVAVMRGRRVAELEREVAKIRTLLANPSESGTATPTATAALVRGGVHTRRAAAPAHHAPTQVSGPEEAKLAGLPTPGLRPAQSSRGLKTSVQSSDPLVEATSAADAFSLAEETAMARAMAEVIAREAPPADKPSAVQPQTAPMGSAPSTSAPQVPTATSPAARRLDAAAIHELVKKLADETGAAQHVQPPETDGADGEPFETEQVEGGDSITKSVRALRAAADAMRPAVPATPATPVEPTFDVELRLAMLADALSADRIDVMLEPILGLKDQATRHYEVSVSLRTPDGAKLDPREDREVLNGTGILPLIDLAKISRIAEVARLLAERGKSGAVFAAVAGESLGDNDFMARFSEVYNDRTAITEQLVISLAQEDVRAFAPAHWAMIQDLCSAGFRFALEHLTDLDMDFDTLRASGIQYVKLDADIFLQGLIAGAGVMVPASDVYNFLADKGLSLIVDHIDTEAQLVRVVDCGVLYGQGQLFGGARPVKAQVFAARSAA